MRDPLDHSTGRSRATVSAGRTKSRRSMSMAAAVIAAGVLGGGAFFASRTLTSMQPIASETRVLAEAAQQRAQFQDGKRLLDRIGGVSTPAPVTAAPAKPAAVQAAAIVPLPKPMPPPAVTIAKAAPPVLPPPAVPDVKLAAAGPEGPGVWREFWDILTLKTSPAAPPPSAKAPLPAVAQPAPAKIEAKTEAKTEPPKLAALPPPAPVPPVPATVLAAPPAFVLGPFNTAALARFRDSDRDRTLAAPPAPLAVAPPSSVAVPVAVAPPVALPSPPVPAVASRTPPPSFGSVDPVPMAAEVAHKSGRQGPIACATIIEQAQIGELSAEDRLILQQRRCR